MAEDVVKVSGFVRITKQMGEDIEALKTALAQPISQEAWETWLAQDDDSDCICGEINARHCPVHNDAGEHG